VGAIAGFVVGYYVGTQQGREGLQQLIESWQYISQSEEFKGAVASAVTMAAGLLKQGARSGPASAVYPALAEGVIDLLARRRAAA
jgi:hypothetical protein